MMSEKRGEEFRRRRGIKKRKYWERGKLEGEVENKSKEERNGKIMGVKEESG